MAHADVDLCMVYDSYTITVLATLEALGFCKRGEGGAFCAGGRIGLGGALPVNTDGGGLSSNHPGHARHLPRHRGDAAAARRVRRARRWRTRDRARARHRRHARPAPQRRDAAPREGVTWRTPKYQKPLPRIDEESRGCWEALARHELYAPALPRLRDDALLPARASARTASPPTTEWVRASGRGTVYTFTVTHQNQAPGFREALPYVLAFVELDEGVRMMTNIVGCPPDACASACRSRWCSRT